MEQYNKDLIFRKARKGDIRNIVKMLADDELGSKREDYKVSREEGIRTLDSISRIHAFQACALNHSATSLILMN